MIGILVFIFIIIFFMQKNSGQRRMRNIRKQLNESKTASEAYGSSFDYDAEGTRTKPSSGGSFGRRYSGRVKQTAAGHMHLKDNKGLALEDREHDWLAMQLREEVRMKRNIDAEMSNLKEEHRRMHRRLNNG